jgi:hypothetical protein
MHSLTLLEQQKHNNNKKHKSKCFAIKIKRNISVTAFCVFVAVTLLSPNNTPSTTMMIMMMIIGCEKGK